MRNPAVVACILALFSALCWGIAGTLAQFLFHHKNISPEWLVTARMLVTGVLMTAFALIRRPKVTLSVFSDRKDTLRLLSFSILGMWSVQYTYFAAINASNAATATIIQYVGPVLIAGWYAAIEKRWPRPLEFLCLFMAIGGVFLLVTHGRPDSLSLSPMALFWGLLAAVALAVYTIQPLQLMSRYPTEAVIGWAMLIGGGLFSLISQPWHIEGVWDPQSLSAFAFIVVFGTLLSFHAYLTAVKLIGARPVSLMACAEPLAAAGIGIVWLKIPFGAYDWLGATLILGTILILTLQEQKPPNTETVKPATACTPSDLLAKDAHAE
ncbi:DMT family transporter [Asticcacaulis tiandongensis]|uniref:DMT family transporter n=1 Tax=Asticcacaulis tiandongensis TaxID=2565365 RepID=UPI00112CA78E|nr:EamA family transporter [Asticcacaulis tiandongensis]